MSDPAYSAPWAPLLRESTRCQIFPVHRSRPRARRHSRHLGDERVDPWFWLRERDDPDVLAYLEAENAYTDASLAHTEQLRDRLYAEIVGRVRETDASAPVRRGSFEYFARTIEGQQYDVHCRRPAGTPGLPDPDALRGAHPGETVVLDENELAQGHDYFAVGDLATNPAPDRRRVHHRHHRRRALRPALPRRSAPTAQPTSTTSCPTCTTASRGRTTTAPCSSPDPTTRCVPGRSGDTPSERRPKTDVLVYQEDDDRFFVSVERARTGRVLVITSASKVTTEVWLVDADDVSAEAARRRTARAGSRVPRGAPRGRRTASRLFVLTNADGAENFALMVTPAETPGRAHWTTCSSTGPTYASTTSTRSPAISWSPSAPTGSSGCGSCDLDDDGNVADDHVVPPDEPVYSMWTGANPEYATPTCATGTCRWSRPRRRTTTTSTPACAPWSSASRSPGTTRPVRDRAAVGDRGRRHPRADLDRLPTRPPRRRPATRCCCTATARTRPPSTRRFSSARVSLLDRGVVYAIAHVRGGGELGRPWYDDGKLLHKRNTFTDFIACAEHLVAEGWTSPTGWRRAAGAPAGC